MASGEIQKKKKKKKHFYAVAKGYSVGIFTSWSQCGLSINKFQGQVYKGFGTIDEAIDFLHPYAFTCKTVPVYNDLSKLKHVQDYGHVCELCITTNNKTSNTSDTEYSAHTITETSSSTISDFTEISDMSEPSDELEQTIIKCPVDTTMVKENKPKSCHKCNELDNEEMIQCNSCNKWIHYSCSLLPPYQIYIFITSSRRYSCPDCVTIPESFTYKRIQLLKECNDKQDFECQTTDIKHLNSINGTNTTNKVDAICQTTESQHQTVEKYIDMTVSRIQQTKLLPQLIVLTETQLQISTLKRQMKFKMVLKHYIMKLKIYIHWQKK